MKRVYDERSIPDFRVGADVPNKLHSADPNDRANCSKKRVYLFT